MKEIERYCPKCDKLTIHKERGFKEHNYRLECLECKNISVEERE